MESTRRTRESGRKPALRDEQGKPICRWCRGSVVRPRRTFCSDLCVHEHRLRSSPAYARQHVKLRDKGHCAECGLKTRGLCIKLGKLTPVAREAALDAMVQEGWPRSIFYRWRRAWDVDHIVPVAEGGGECGLDNLRTLCLRCHHAQTTELRARLKGRQAA